MSDRVAVVGMSIRAARVRDPSSFWRLLSTGGCGRREISPEELARRGVAKRRYQNPDFVPVTFAMDDSLAFDAPAFGIDPSEAELIDPQHRVMLEACYRAVESAGCFIGALPDRVGVFVGLRASDYGARIGLHHAAAGDDLDPGRLALGTDPDYLAGRISYTYGLTGPSMAVLTACSSSSVAVHLACQAILAGECDSALAGGVAVNVRDAGYRYVEGGLYSPRGRCEPYTATADGTVDGNGVAALFLRRLDVALAEGNPILGVVAGTAVNNDGRERAGFTAPGIAGQVELIGEALEVARLKAAQIGLLEGHGTGTRIGDALEIDAASQAYRSSGAEPGACRLHSVKANVGNLTAAAGAAGIVAALLALRHGTIPPNAPLAHGARPADLDGTPFAVADGPIAWPRAGQGRYAAISSFGLGGTNAHVIIGDAEPEPRAAARRGRSWQVLPVSADDPPRLTAAVEAVRAAVASAAPDERRNLGHTLRTGRPQLAARAAVLVPVDGGPAEARRSRIAPEQPPVLVFVLPGRGVGGFAGYTDEPAFRSAVDDGLVVMERALAPEAFTAVRDAVRRGEVPAAAPVRQPVLHLAAVGQHALLGTLGIRPDALVGEGVGELTAAHLSGVLSFDDAARAVCWRGRADADADPVEAARLAGRLRELRLHAPTVPILSAVTGAWLTDEEARDPGYWGAQLRAPAELGAAVRTVAARHPGAVYLHLSGTASGAADDAVIGRSLPQTVGELWERGVPVDWNAYAERDPALRIDTAPRRFDRTAYVHPALREDHHHPADLSREQAS
ncbi:beta-ketoacyl synthase N-terminal-like domain-containing protein [Dactylosporangium sp. NPDC000244]|uniref:beta-ketoacyl synthase N-terminal-like domain-containing protein n=1 Tax=Dactylosporangium sp. NPDC000244 TaxID=3154365 RepID=UPI00332350CE